MKKLMINKYGSENRQDIISREWTEDDIPQSIRNYVKNSGGTVKLKYK